MIYNATHDTTGEEEAMMNDLIAQIPEVERLLLDEEETIQKFHTSYADGTLVKPILTRVIEFIASRSYHIGYEHGKKDCGSYIAELEAIIAKNKPEEPCPECGGMGFTIGFSQSNYCPVWKTKFPTSNGQTKKKFPCSTCSTFNRRTGDRE